MFGREGGVGVALLCDLGEVVFGGDGLFDGGVVGVAGGEFRGGAVGGRAGAGGVGQPLPTCLVGGFEFAGADVEGFGQGGGVISRFAPGRSTRIEVD